MYEFVSYCWYERQKKCRVSLEKTSEQICDVVNYECETENGKTMNNTQDILFTDPWISEAQSLSNPDSLTFHFQSRENE